MAAAREAAAGRTSRATPTSAPGGYFGRALVVDVTDGASEVLELDERVLRSCIGGAGLGTWLMHRLAPPRVDPLAPEAPLAFVLSPLVGTPLTTSAKFAVVAKSPLTGRLNDALASTTSPSPASSPATTRSSCAAPATTPSVLVVDGAGAARRARRRELWGLPAAEAEKRLRARLGAGFRVPPSAPRASASSASPPSPTTAATPAAAASAPCWAPSGSRRSPCAAPA